ncbi:MAG: Helix-turn-helix domain [Bacteroidota bacterium]|jgi:excisionase family DNA binding protein
MEQNVIFSIPTEITIREIFRQELKEFLTLLIISIREKDKPVYLTSVEAANLLHISLPTIRRWTKDGLLPNYRFGNSRRVLYKYEEVKQLLERKNLMKWKIAC